MNNSSAEITKATDYLNKTVDVEMDRQLGAKHDKFGWAYELNYGFVPGTMSPDGEELDAYVIGVDEPMEKFTGTCVAVIHRINDDDDKLIVVTDDRKDITDEDIRKLTEFQEKFFESVIQR